MSRNPGRPTLGLVIRFKNSAGTLPAVLDAVRGQTVQPDLIVGVNNESTDNSAALLVAAGAKIVDWTRPYSHPRVMNFAAQNCPTDLVLVLSSHTRLRSPDAIARLVAAMADPRVACASGKWDADSFYSDAIDWAELKAKGLKFCSIYSNSMGIFRRSLWEQVPFDESVISMEDSAWAVEQVHRGFICRRLDFGFEYLRRGGSREFAFAVATFKLAGKHGLRGAWLGVVGTLRGLPPALVRGADGRQEATVLLQRLVARFAWRFIGPLKE